MKIGFVNACVTQLSLEEQLAWAQAHGFGAIELHGRPDKVKVDLKKLSVQILTPPTQNFDFLDTIQLYLSAAGQPEMLVAYQYVIPKGATTLDFFTVTDVNLKNYFLADTMYFRMRARINTVPEGGTKLNIASVFHMLANPLD